MAPMIGIPNSKSMVDIDSVASVREVFQPDPNSAGGCVRGLEIYLKTGERFFYPGSMYQDFVRNFNQSDLVKSDLRV